MELFFFFMVCLLVSCMMLYEVGVDVCFMQVDGKVKCMLDGCDYWQINFMGQVLVLCMFEGWLLIENVVVLQYLVEVWFEVGLLFVDVDVCVCVC